ncbi:hypothetical protein ACTXT7_000980 [Hymenolepis weldensis]
MAVIGQCSEFASASLDSLNLHRACEASYYICLTNVNVRVEATVKITPDDETITLDLRRHLQLQYSFNPGILFNQASLDARVSRNVTLLFLEASYYAFRNSVYGSWFIQALNNGLRKYGHILDLMSILTRVNYEVAFEFESLALTAEYSGKKQVPSVVSTLTKDVFFPPKTPPSEPVPSTSCSRPPTP